MIQRNKIEHEMEEGMIKQGKPKAKTYLEADPDPRESSSPSQPNLMA